MTVLGISTGLSMALFMERSVNKFGPRTVYIMCFRAMLFVFPAYILLNALAVRAGGHADVFVWIVLAVQLICASANFACFGKSLFSDYDFP